MKVSRKNQKSKSRRLKPLQLGRSETFAVGAVSLVNAMMMAGTAEAQNATTNNVPRKVGSGTSATAPAKKADGKASRLPEVLVTGEQDDSAYKPNSLSTPNFDVPLRDIPQVINVIPQAVMEDQNVTSLRDALRNVSGISIQAGEGGFPAGDNLSIRGFNARTDMFIDGVRDFGGYSRDPFYLESVEVTKGPSSTSAGRGSTGGFINLVTKKPHLKEAYGGTVGYGTDDYTRLTLDVNQPIKDERIPGAAFRFNALWHEADTPGREEVYNSRWGVAPSWAFGLGTDTQVYFNYFHLSQDNIPDYGIPWVPNTNIPLSNFSDKAPPVSFDNFYGLLDRDYEETYTDLISGTVEHTFNDSLSLRNHTQYGQTVRDSIISAPRFANITTTAINRNPQSRDQIDAIIANTTDLTVEFDTWWVKHRLVPGVTISRESSENYPRTISAAPQADLFDPNPFDPYGGTISSSTTSNKANAYSYSLYVFDTATLNEQWQLLGGLRYEHFAVDFQPTVGAEIGRSDDMVSGRGGVVYKPVPEGSIYTGFGNSYNPSSEGLTLSTSGTSAASAQLPPEENFSFEVGTKWELLGGKLGVNAAGFLNQKTNARTEDPADTTDILVLEGEQEIIGFELGAAGNITKEWSIYGGYTFLCSEITSSKNPAEVGKQLSNTPEHSLSLWTAYELPWNFEAGAGVQFVDDRFNNNTNQRKAPEYHVVDAMLGYEVNKNVTIRLNVYNLADERYIDRVGGGHFIPGPGRSATVTTSFFY
jgi:catecholate siderophore receptor